MGSSKKHKAKKRKRHSRDTKEDEDCTSAGKMKVIFRVPPPHPPSPPDPSLVVSLPIEDIARARHYLSEEGETTPTKSSRKHKRKRHHHHSKSSPHIIVPPTEQYGDGSISERDEDNSAQPGKNATSSSIRRPLYGKGKDLYFHKLPGKETAYQKAHLGPPCLDTIDSDQDDDSYSSYHRKLTKRDKRDTLMSLPVEISLDMLLISPRRPRGSGGKDMRLFKPPATIIKESSSHETLPTRSSSSLLHLSTDLSNQSGLSDDGEIRKKRKKKKKMKNDHDKELPKKAKKVDDTTFGKKSSKSGQPPAPIVELLSEESFNEPDACPDHHDSNDVIMESHEEPNHSLLVKRAHSPADSSIISAPSPASSSSSRLHGVKLPRSALRFFLKHLHHQIQRSDPEGVFAEPVTDDIAPNYSTIIKQPMDLQTMAVKIDSNSYSTVEEFKDDFTLMCNNAMVYNTPETQYHQFSKQLLDMGIKLIQKEISVRPDIRHGVIPTFVASPQPPLSIPALPSNSPQLDYTSPFVCKLELASLRPSVPAVTTTVVKNQVLSGNSACLPDTGAGDENSVIDVSGEPMEDEVVDQSYLTQVQVGYDNEEGDPGLAMFNQTDDVIEEEDVLQQVDEAYVEMKENTLEGDDHVGTPQPELSYLVNDESGKTVLNILNPYSVSSHSVNLNVLADKVKAGDNASTVLNTELPVFKATPVSYLMYGPFGSFAPTYDTSFANLTKHDSSLLLSTYGNELGINYANSLQQFVKGCGSFATEMADAILNSLTNGRHMKFMESIKKDEEKKISGVQKKEVAQSKISTTSTTTSIEVDKKEIDNSEHVSKGDRQGSLDDEEMKNLDEVVTKSSDLSPEEQLGRTSSLLMELESEQNERLSQLPQQSYETKGDFVLPGPSQNELNKASQVTSKIALLTAQGNPDDFVPVPSLQQAMGTHIQTTSKQSHAPHVINPSIS